MIAGESIKKCQLFAIGDSTEQTILDMGATITAKADIATAKGLAEKIKQIYQS